MNINNIRGLMGYSRNSVINDLNSEKINSRKFNLKQSSEYRDKIDISKSARNISSTRGIGLCLDKGTAANTTLYVNRSTFNQIASYTTNNPDCKWDELGVDGEKRWVVVNGQRFECPLSKEEKEARKRLEECNLIAILAKADKEKEAHKIKSEKHNSVKLTLNEKNKIKKKDLKNYQSNDKIRNLMKNDKVMKMLSDIISTNGNKSITLGLNY